jgi:CRP-like cAMP-binding protein
MTRPSHLHDAVIVALEALHCPPDELAQLLGVDLRELNRLRDSTSQVPPALRYRLASLLLQRASVLRRVAGNLTRRPTSARRAQLVATLAQGRARAEQSAGVDADSSAIHTIVRAPARSDLATPLAARPGGTWYYAEPTR